MVTGLARALIPWLKLPAPRASFAQGLRRTIAWYRDAKDRDQVRRLLDAGGLYARKVGAA
jgi:hypothetical protein